MRGRRVDEGVDCYCRNAEFARRALYADCNLPTIRYEKLVGWHGGLRLGGSKVGFRPDGGTAESWS